MEKVAEVVVVVVVVLRRRRIYFTKITITTKKIH